MKKHYFSAAAAFLAVLSVSASPATEEAAKLVAENNLPNLVKNGSFEKVGKDGRAVNWTFWKSDKSNGKVEFEKDTGVKDTGAVFTAGSSSLFTSVKVNPGEKVFVRIKTCKSGEGTASLSLRFQNEERQWLPFTVRKKIAFPKDGEWTTAEIVVKAPAKAARVIPMIGASGLDNPDSKIVFDELEVYNLSSTAEK